MKKKLSVSIAVLFAVLICFSSCSILDIFSTESLLRAPKLTGEYAVLQKAFEEAVNTEIEAISPVSGDYRSSYVMADLDGDGVDEAIVFYSPSNADDIAHLHVLSFYDREWHSLGDITGSGSGVFEMSVNDLDGDGCKELIVVWTVSESPRDKKMSVYSLSGGNDKLSAPTALATVQLCEYFAYDFDSNGSEELFFIGFSSSEDTESAYVQVLDFCTESKIPEPLSRVDLTYGITNITSVKHEKMKDDTAIYLDCQTAEGGYITEVLRFSAEDNSLSAPLRNASSDSDTVTSRSGPAVCKDINSDGKLEIPCAVPFADGSYPQTVSGRTVTEMIQWKCLSDTGLTEVTKYFVNYNDGYCLCMDSLYSVSVANYDASSRTARWYTLSPGSVSGSRSASVKNGEESSSSVYTSDDIIFSVIFSGNNDSDSAEGNSAKTVLDNLVTVISDKGKEMNLRTRFIRNLIKQNDSSSDS